MKVLLTVVVLGLGMGLYASCMSDFDCGMGHSCVKKPYSSSGVCMKSVNEYGVQQFDMPSMDSVGPNMNRGGCDFNTDCPVGFKCDLTYKTCIKY